MSNRAEGKEQTFDLVTDPGVIDPDTQSRVDRIVTRLGNAVAWVIPLLMIAICAQVVLRNLGHNQAWLDDAQWWLYGLTMTFGIGYAITTQSHVRIDIFYQSLPPRKKTLIEIFGLGWMLMPFLAVMTDILFHYGWASVRVREGSDSPNGLHHLYLLKIALPLIFAMSCLAAGSIMVRHLRDLCPPRLWTVIIAMFPAAWFIAERVAYYALWWSFRLADRDLNPRLIAREDVFRTTIWLGFALVALLMGSSFLRQRLSKGR